MTDSPCVNICVVDRDSGLCLGCLRTLDEIAGWGGLTSTARRRRMGELPAREARLGARARRRRAAAQRNATSAPPSVRT
jgi:predicted Fe-S protein YdhL (DUF1289 family)